MTTFDVLIRGATVVRMNDGRATVGAADLAIAGERIAAIEAPETIDPGRSRDVWPGNGFLAIPGLVNTHAHMAMTLFRGLAEDVTVEGWFNERIWPIESNVTDEDVHLGALLGLAEMIRGGITTVADHYFCTDAVGRAVETAGTRAVLAPAVFGTGPDPEQELDDAVGLVERWQGAAGGRITTVLGPHSPYLCPLPVLEAVGDRARDLGVGAHIHLAETQAQTDDSRRLHGKTPVEVLAASGLLDVPTLCAHSIAVTPSDIEVLAAAGASVAHCPKTAMKMALGAAPVVAMREAGVAVGLGCDGPASNSTLDILEAMRLAAMLQKHERRDPLVLPVAEVVHMATADGARALDLDDIGDLQVGMRADVVLLRTDAPHMRPGHDPLSDLVYAARPEDVDTVLCDGRVVMRERRLLTLDVAAIGAELAGNLERLRHRIPGQRFQTYPGAV